MKKPPKNKILDLLRTMRKQDEDISFVGANDKFDPMFDAPKKPEKHTNKTTKQERQALREHIEELDKELKRKPIKAKPINKFNINDVVELLPFDQTRTKGKVLYITCRLALPSIKECDKKDCKHNNKNYVWVVWKDGKIFSYRFTKLRLMTADELSPKIGRELSGRIGPWIYDAIKKIWKKDGDNKFYTNDEFADILYFEQNPYAKEESIDFVRAIMKEKSFH
jgi:hypothetical protein